MFYHSFIHILSLFLFVNSGSNDVLISCATQIGSRSCHRRLLIFFTSISLIFTYYALKNIQGEAKVSGTNTIWAINELMFVNSHIPRSIYSISLFTAAIFLCFSVISGYVLPFDTIFVSFFYGYFTSMASPSDDTFTFHLKRMSSTFFLSYLVMPVVSGCFTWLTYRILIRGVMYADEEDKFNMTLGWCGIIYPTALSAIFTIFTFKFFLYNSSFPAKTLLGYLVIIASWIFAFVLFKVFIRAWIKRRAFLMYPQEYAVYMERSEKIEQGDREARGLGPIQDYYVPKIYVANSTSTNGTKAPPPSSSSIKDNNSAIVPEISPAVIAGKLAISSKRSEELFSPILNLISIISLFLLSSFESSNLYIIVSLSIDSKPSIWFVLPAILVGTSILSNRHGRYLGRNIISEMTFSQAFSIQLGVLLTITLSLLHSIPLAPMWFLLAAIAAVCATNPDRSEQVLKQPSLHETGSEDEKGVSFRSKLLLMVFFWACSIGFGYSVGFLSTLL